MEYPIEKILKIMEQEAKNAPVFIVENETKKPFEILLFTMLSSRTKDETTLKALKKLQEKIGTTAKQLAVANQKEVEETLYGVGFYKEKARRVIEIAKTISKKGFPKNLEEMLALPGVGRKTANIVLARVYGYATLGVDVHVHRISNRLGLVKTKKPEETERELVRIIPKKYINRVNKIFVAYGQTICTPKKPKCNICKIRKYCKQIGVNQ